MTAHQAVHLVLAVLLVLNLPMSLYLWWLVRRAKRLRALRPDCPVTDDHGFLPPADTWNGPDRPRSPYSPGPFGGDASRYRRAKFPR